MPLNPTSIKLTPADHELISELKSRHGITSLIALIRSALMYMLIHKPVEKKDPKP